MSKIIVVDDEPQILKLLEITLQANGFQVFTAITGEKAIPLIASHNPDLVLLDLSLPDISGQDLLKKIRLWYTNAVVILTANHAEEEVVTALENGATDFLVKPFRNAELIARIKAAIRHNLPQDNSNIWQQDGLTIDLVRQQVQKNEMIVKLTVTEYQLLSLFVKYHGRVLTHHFLLKQVWGTSYQNEYQYLRVFIRSLRQKIEPDPNKPKYIITENGVGYRFN